MTCYLMDNYDAAHAHISTAITLTWEIGERSWLVSFLETATWIEMARQNRETARCLCDEGLTLSEERDDRHDTAFYHHNAGEIVLAQGKGRQSGHLLRPRLSHPP